MELHHLRSFLALADAGHFGRAADRLGLTQPALSRRIQQVEAVVGVALFDRGAKPIKLTPAGEIFRPEAQRSLEMLQHATRRARQAASGQSGKLRVGLVGCVSSALAPRLVEEFGRRSPGAQLSFRELPQAEHATALRSGELDVCISFLPATDAGLIQRYLYSEQLVIMLPERHPLAKLPGIPFAALTREKFVACPIYREAGFHELVLEHCRQAGFSPQIVGEAAGQSLLATVVARGAGLSIVAKSFSDMPAEGVVYRPIADPVRPVRVGALWERGTRNPLLRPFVDAAVACTTRPAPDATALQAI